MTPVEYLCFMFGGQKKLALELGVSKQAVFQWKAKGKIPNRHGDKIIALIVARGLSLTLEDIAQGRKIA